MQVKNFAFYKGVKMNFDELLEKVSDKNMADVISRNDQDAGLLIFNAVEASLSEWTKVGLELLTKRYEDKDSEIKSINLILMMTLITNVCEKYPLFILHENGLDKMDAVFRDIQTVMDNIANKDSEFISLYTAFVFNAFIAGVGFASSEELR
jgi:hypothetical protein